MRLQIFYRTHPGGNGKLRPPWFGRDTCLLSLRDALERSGHPAIVTVVADGGLPPEIEPLLTTADRVRLIRGGTAAASLRATVNAAAAAARSAPDDVFWLCEDDYLYRPEAFRHLAAAVTAIGEAEYFTLFRPRPSGWSSTHPSQPDREFPELPGGPRLVDGLRWTRFPCTTSTFGVRGSALRRDAGLVRLGTRPGAPFDGATWHMLQGARPYSWRHLFHDIDPYLTHRGLAKIVGKPAMRVALNIAATRVARHPRTLVAPVVNQSVHVEASEVQGSPEWQRLAESLQRSVSSPG